MKAKVLFPQGLFFNTSRLPANWAIMSTEKGTLDVFIFSKEELNQEDIVVFELLSVCRIKEDESTKCDIIIGVAITDETTKKDIKTFEAEIGAFIHANWKILSWSNKKTALQLLKIEYNI